MKTKEEIKELIAKIEGERLDLMADYAASSDEQQQSIIAGILMEKSFTIKHLEWVMK